MAVQPSGPTGITLLVLLPLVAWRIYARIRRMVGRQRASRIRPWITLAVFPLVVLLLGLAGWHTHPLRLAWLAGGLAIGGALGVYGLRKTTFEPTPQGLFYTPNAHLGIALSLLLVARIIYRLVEVFVLHPPGPGSSPDDFASSPLTLVVFGVLAGYYVSYAIGLVRWRARVFRAKHLREAAQAENSRF
ncbi:MAG: hypothetical protein V4864_08440 [Pseudomonadota bacterium]